MERRRRRLTLAPMASADLAGVAHPRSPEGSGSRFDCLNSECCESEIEEEDGIPFRVASMALAGESEEGLTPVSGKMKSDSETVADFWREIGFPTPASRFWEGSRRSTGETSILCRSTDVLGVVDLQGTPLQSPPVGSSARGAASSPS
jgi:hypothetical protein